MYYYTLESTNVTIIFERKQIWSFFYCLYWYWCWSPIVKRKRGGWNHINWIRPATFLYLYLARKMNFHQQMVWFFFVCSMIWGERQLFLLFISIELLTIIMYFMKELETWKNYPGTWHEQNVIKRMHKYFLPWVCHHIVVTLLYIF